MRSTLTHEDFELLYVPCSTVEEAKKIAAHLLEEKLIACANIHPQILSMYRWKGDVESSSESLLFLKTSKSLTPQVRAKVTSIHSYECPCILGLSLSGCNSEYLNWMKHELE